MLNQQSSSIDRQIEELIIDESNPANSGFDSSKQTSSPSAFESAFKQPGPSWLDKPSKAATVRRW